MDIKGLRSMSLIGIILFFLIGLLLASVYFYQFYRIASHFPDSEYSICMGLIIVWISIIIIFTFLFYNYIIISLDHGKYKTAKSWTLIGIIVGFAGGIIPLIIFIISYASFDDAIRTEQFRKTYYSHPQPPYQFKDCHNCKKKIPFDSKLCPYCGEHQSPIQP